MTFTHPMKVSMQSAHHAHDESQSLGTMDAQEVMSRFDTIDWDHQAKRANELNKTAPTFAIERGASLIWVSVAGLPPHIEFVSSYSAPGRVKRLFGLLSSDGIVEKHRTDLTPQEARQAIEAFTSNDIKTLDILFNT